MSNKLAIVTAGNKGIGLSITKALIEQGYHVVVGGRSQIEIEKNYLGNLNFIKADLTKESSHRLLIENALKIQNKIDLYVNNLGISSWRPIEKIDDQFLDNILSTNLKSAFFGCKVASEKMRSGSSIINISSIAGKRGSSNNSAYCASKFALNGLTQSLAKELGHRGIRVNALCPVLIETEGLLEALGSKYSPANKDPIGFISDFAKTNSALGRLPKGEDVAKMCIMLASENASAITGQCINVDCGVFPQ